MVNFNYDIVQSGQWKWIIVYKDKLQFWVSTPSLNATETDLITKAKERWKGLYPDIEDMLSRRVVIQQQTAGAGITGIVTLDGKPASGASITLLDVNNKQTGRGTAAGSAGDFFIYYNPKDTIAIFLSVTYVGCKEYKVAITKELLDSLPLKVSLERNLAELGDLETVTIKVKRVKPAETAKGVEKFVLLSAKQLANIENKIDDIFEKVIEKPLKVINEVDVCNIINYFLSKATTDLILGKDSRLKFEFDKIRNVANRANEKISAFTTFSSITNSPRTFPGSTTATPNTSRSLEKQKIVKLIREIDQEVGLTDLFRDVPPQLLSFIPVLKKSQQTVIDLTAYFSKYKSIEDIPNDDIQKIVGKIQDLQGILGAVASINSAQGLVNLLNLQKQIDKVQKVINPARIIPEIKAILKVANSINQIGLKILKIISFARFIVKLLLTIIKVCNFIIKLFHFLFLPGAFTWHGLTSILESTKEAIKEQKSKLIGFLEQIRRLLDLINNHVVFLLEKVQILIRELQILLLNLQACEQTRDLPIVDETKTVLQDLQDTGRKLQDFADRYNNQRANGIKIPGYTIDVIEEELVDEGKTLKRRRAVAYNDRGVLVLQGDLTFATDKAILIEELRLKLVQQGYVQTDNSVLGIEDQILLNGVSDILNIDIEDVSYNPDTLAGDNAEVAADIDNFISNLPGGRKLKKKVREKIQKQVSETKDRIKKEGINATSSASSTIGVIQSSTPQDSSTQNLLSDKERNRLNTLIKVFGNIKNNPGLQKLVTEAKLKLEEDAKARARLSTS